MLRSTTSDLFISYICLPIVIKTGIVLYLGEIVKGNPPEQSRLSINDEVVL